MRWLLVALVLCQACALEALTEVVVLIEAEARVRMRSESLFVRVSTRDGQTVLENSNAPWTDGRYTLGLASKGDASRYVVEARALEGGVAIARARLISGFVHGQTRYVRLLLEDACVGMLSCGEGTTCRAGECVDADVAPEELGTDPDKAPTSTTLAPTSTQMERDAGEDASLSVPDARTEERDARIASSADAATADAATQAPPDAGSPVGSACKPGYYEGTWSGDYAYSDLGFEMQTKIEASSTVDAPVLSLVLTVEGSGLRISKSCVSSTMLSAPSRRPFLARLDGSFDCSTGVLRGGALSGYYTSGGQSYTFSGELTGRLDGEAVRNGTWFAEEPPDISGSTGDGEGSWSASWKAQTAPAIIDPCADVP